MAKTNMKCGMIVVWKRCAQFVKGFYLLKIILFAISHQMAEAISARTVQRLIWSSGEKATEIKSERRRLNIVRQILIGSAKETLFGISKIRLGSVLDIKNGVKIIPNIIVSGRELIEPKSLTTQGTGGSN